MSRIGEAMFCCDVGTTDAESFLRKSSHFCCKSLYFFFYFLICAPLPIKQIFYIS